MKIGIVSTAYPLRGGIAHFVGLLYKELSKNHEVKITTFKRQYPSLLFPGKTQMDNKDSIEQVPSEVLVDSINPFNWIKVGRKLKKGNYDLLIFKYWMPFFAPCFAVITRIAKKNKKTKAMVICDNVIPHEKRPGDNTLTKYFFKAVDSFVLMSESVRKDLLTLKPSAKHKLLFHPVYSNFGSAVDKAEAKEHLKINSEKVILFFGFIRKYKGLDNLLDAMAIILKEMDLHLLVAGEFYTDKEEYFDQVKNLGISGNVTFASDFIPSEDVKYYFSATDVVILPYKSATQSGIVQIANNFHKPLIGTDTGGLGEIIKDDVNGYLVEPENSKALAEAILKFYNGNKEEEFSEKVKDEQDRFSWAKFVEGIESLI